ncbi:hypothetical protein [Symbiobacterium thermophilum]
MEFNTARGAVRIYHLDSDGELIAAAEHRVEASAPLGPTNERRR